jgi:hypothetical protein
MIVVTAMPVVNAKARTITTKITFMSLALCIGPVTMAEPAGRSVTDITEHRFSADIGGAGRRRISALSSCVRYCSGFIPQAAGALDRNQNSMSAIRPSGLAAPLLLPVSLLLGPATRIVRQLPPDFVWDLFQ